MESPPKCLHYAYWIAFACCVLCGVTVGLTYSCAGIFIAPVSQAIGAGVGKFSLYLTIQGIAVTLFLPFAGKLIATKDSRIVLSVAVAINGGVFILNSFWTSVYPFYVTAVFMGFAQAFLLVLVAPTLINFWFKEKVGFTLGICLSFTGIGGIIFNPLGAWLITNYGWQMAYRTFGLLVLVLCLPLTLFVVRRTPAEKGLLRYGESAADANQQKAQAASLGVSRGVALKTPAFYALMLMTVFITMSGSQVFHIPSFVQSVGRTAAMAGIIASVVMAGNLVGKLIIGWLLDKNLMMALAFGSICGAAGFGLFTLFNNMDYALYVGAFLFGVCYAMSVTVPPMFTRKAFGQKEYTQIYAIVSMAGMLLNSFASSGWGFLKETAGSYSTGYWLCLVFMLLCIPVGLFALQSVKKLQQ